MHLGQDTAWVRVKKAPGTEDEALWAKRQEDNPEAAVSLKENR